jgi:hypothetical protein
VIKLLILAFFTFVIGHILLRFARGIKATVSDTKPGKAIYIQTSIGRFDLKSNSNLHPALANILVYPGATPAESQPPEYEADVQVLGREFRVFVATYWTLTPADVVWEFYRRELPGWQESRQRGRGRSLMRREPDCERTVRVYGQNGSTLIEKKVSMKGLASAAAAASSGSSDSGSGVLR